MALIVEDGTARSDAESYLSVADADAYFAARGNPSTWTGLATGVKEQYLREATEYLDQRYAGRWLGVRVKDDQALAWPRYGVYDADSYALNSDAVPRDVKRATAEAALARAKGDTFLAAIAAPGLIASESVAAGPVSSSTSYVGGKSQVKAFPKIEALLAQFILDAGRIVRG